VRGYWSVERTFYFVVDLFDKRAAHNTIGPVQAGV
jgi:hypothetical protein